MNVLACLLGLSPGVATGAFYALARDRKIPIDRLVTVGTNAPMADACEREIVEELRRWEILPDVSGVKIPEYDYDLDEPIRTIECYTFARDVRDYREYLKRSLLTDNDGSARERPVCRIRIPYEDVTDRQSAAAFREMLLVLVRDIYRDDAVYLCLSGGRKSMAAIAMLAAQFGQGVRRLFHLHNHEPRAESEDASVLSTYWSYDYEEKKGFLRPRREKLALIDIPFFRIAPGIEGPEMYIPENEDDDEGAPERFVLDFLEENKRWVVLDVRTEERVVTAFFEERVADHLWKAGYEVRRSPKAALLESRGVYLPRAARDPYKPCKPDLVGFKANQVLLVECKCYTPKDKDSPARVKLRDAEQAGHYLATKLDPPDRSLKVWLVSTAIDVENEEVWCIPGIELYSTGPAMADRMRRAAWGKKWRALLEGDLEVDLYPMRRPVRPRED